MHAQSAQRTCLVSRTPAFEGANAAHDEVLPRTASRHARSTFDEGEWPVRSDIPVYIPRTWKDLERRT